MTPRSRRCFKTHTEYTSFAPSEEASLTVSRRLCPSERGAPFSERTGRLSIQIQVLNVGNAQIRTLLDRQQILAECQAENKNHEFQAVYDRRSVRKLCEIIEMSAKFGIT